jgi:hypothetical protein
MTIRYRTEMSDSSERDAVSVMLFEITELHNTDILEYVRDNYNLPNILKRNIDEYIENIDEIEEGDENVAYMLKEILGCIEDETTITVNYALWLADKDSVIDNYEGSEREIYGYKIDNAIVLSDLGWDGTLYGFEDEPEPVEIYDGENETVTESMIKKASVLLYD